MPTSLASPGWNGELKWWRGLRRAGVEAFVLAGLVMFTVVVADLTWCMCADALWPPVAMLGSWGSWRGRGSSVGGALLSLPPELQ